MFEKTYIFQGAHAEKVKILTNEANLFNRYIDVLILAPIIGFLNGIKADISKGEETAKIFSEQIIKEREKIKFIFQLITMLNENYSSNIDERVNLAFRVNEGEEYEKCLDIFNQYVRGGVNFLYDKVINVDDINKIKTYPNEEFLNNFITYIDDFNKDLEAKESDEDIEEIISNFEM